MRATVINVGAELLSGQTHNRHLETLAEGLMSKDITIHRAHIVGDHKADIKQALETVDTELIILSGGLGPTEDDVTKEAVAEHFRLELVKDHASLTRIQNYFARAKRTMSETNLKQAYFPQGATIIDNPVGTAPGALFTVEDRHVLLLPGPPAELEPMFKEALEHLKTLHREKRYEAGYRLVGIGESDLEVTLRDVYRKHPGVVIAPYADIGEIRVLFVSKNQTLMEKALDDFNKRYREYIVGPHDQTLESRVVNTLLHQEKTISFVESCTGGMLTSRLINVPDASHVFSESHVLYSNASKIKQLGVNQVIMERFGAVSDQCVYELAYQLAQRTRAAITMSVSGIAGPTGGTPDKPVGTVYFGLHHEGKTHTYHKVFSGDRNAVRQKATSYGLFLILRALMHEDDC